MVLTLKVLNEDATLNNWTEKSSAQLVRGADGKLVLQLFQQDRKIRYIPAVGAVITISLLNSDQTTVDKTATNPFADDRSIIQFDLSDTETENIIGQALIVEINEGAVKSFAILQQGLQMLSTSTSEC